MSADYCVCGHPWPSHQGRNGGQRCCYRQFGRDCPCRRINPAVKAEDRLAAALWNAYLGRDRRLPETS